MDRLVVTSMASDGLGTKSGLRTGDVLVSYDGHPLDSLDRLVGCIASGGEGDAALMVYRGGARVIIPVQRSRLEISVELTELPSDLLREVGSVGISLSSGDRLEVTEIALVDAVKLEEARALFDAAKENFQGYSSPFGFIGDPLWVVMNHFASSTYDARRSRKMAKAGQEQLDESIALVASLRSRPQFVPVVGIANVHLPSPNLWLGYGRANEPLVHGGEQYVVAKTSTGKLVSIVVSQIALYEPLYKE